GISVRDVSDAGHALLALGAPALLGQLEGQPLGIDHPVLGVPALGLLLDARGGIEGAEPPIDVVDALDLEAGVAQPELGRPIRERRALAQQAESEVPVS